MEIAESKFRMMAGAAAPSKATACAACGNVLKRWAVLYSARTAWEPRLAFNSLSLPKRAVIIDPATQKRTQGDSRCNRRRSGHGFRRIGGIARDRRRHQRRGPLPQRKRSLASGA